MQKTSPFSKIAEKYGLRLILLFGSQAKGFTHAQSDLDIAVEFRGAAPEFKKQTELSSALQDIYPDQIVDLAILNRADPLFANQVTENCTLLYGDETHLAEVKAINYRRYIDHTRFFAMEKEYVRKRIDKG
ncbi:MAG: nucleotidyltransferase domain-containing protein [Gammaproteobacteria bacterium]|nr:nucleotidyltransferase domain-containing protein [Gammaproteobacteria bacterium]MDH5693337.1 nucleotidyltransferase domain-containing protein [Gammaproteobacteria bacterium]